MLARSVPINPIRRGISRRPVPASRSIGRLCGLALIGSSWVVCAGAAQAQTLFDRTENVAVASRPRPEYDPVGLRLGTGFLMYPELTVGETFDDNVFEQPSSDLLDVLAKQLPDPQRFTQFTNKLVPLTDAVLSIKPSIEIKSNWNQHSLKLTASTTIDRSAEYPDFSANFPQPFHTAFGNSEQYDVAADGTLNVYHDLTVNVDASYGHQFLPRTFDGYLIINNNLRNLGVQASFSPLFKNVAAGKVEVIKDFARFRLTLSGEFQNYDYTNGLGPTFNFNYNSALQPNPARSTLKVGPVDQAFHNHDNPIEYLRGDYALSGDVALFAEETATETRYPTSIFHNRLSNETLVGVNFQITNLVTAEIGVGNLYDVVYAAGLKPVDTPDGRINLTYFPTTLIDVTLTAREFIVDSGIPQSPNFLDKSIALQTNYELLRNLILAGHATINFEDYRVVDRHIQTYEEGLSATYLMNRGLKATLAYTRRDDTSNGTEAVVRQFKEFGEDSLSLSFTLQH